MREQRLFISYARANEAVVAELVQDLRELGHEPFFDQEISGGEKWWQKLLDEIESADAFLPVMSVDFLASEPCHAEAEWAHSAGIPILPIDLGDVDPELCEPYIHDVNWVRYDATSKVSALRLARALDAVPAPARPTTLPPRPETPGAYLRELEVEINGDEEMPYRRQLEIVQRLRKKVKARGDSGARALLVELRDRDDVSSKVVATIDAILAEEPGAKSPALPVSRSAPSGGSTDTSAPPGSLRVEAPVQAALLGTDARRLAYARGMGSVHVWDLDGGRASGVCRLGERRGAVRALTWVRDPYHVAVGYADGWVQIWDADNEVPMAEAAPGWGDDPPVCALAATGDGRYVFAGYRSGRIRVVDTAGRARQELAVPTGASGAVTALTVAADGGMLSAYQSGMVVAWQPQQGPVANMGHPAPVGVVAVAPSGRWVATGSADGRARLWSRDGWVAVRKVTVDSAVTALAFSPDEHLLAVGTADGWVTVFAPDASVRTQLHAGDVVRALGWRSPTALAVVGGDGVVLPSVPVAGG